jgi:predicted TIM-barrel fold metal-dependent hydrolase
MPVLNQLPDPNPVKPKFELPPGACDTHVHLFGPSDKYRFASDSPYTSQDALPEVLFALQDAVGLSTAVIVSPGGYGCDYTMLADVLAAYPERLRGIALMPENTPHPEIERLGKLGVRGLRMISEKRGGHLPHFNRAAAERAHEHGWHVQFYPYGTDIIDYADKLMSLPNDIVLDHFASIPAAGGVDQPAVKAVLRMLESGRVWLKLSGPMRCTMENPPYASVTPLAKLFVAHAPERLVWGSDWPHVNMNGREMPNDGHLIDLMAEWAPDETVRNRIFATNANLLYGFN